MTKNPAGGTHHEKSLFEEQTIYFTSTAVFAFRSVVDNWSSITL